MKRSRVMATRPINSDDRAVAFAFIHFLNSLEVRNEESAETVKRLVASIFEVDPQGKNGPHDKGIDLVAASKQYLANASADPLKDEKFLSFLDLLRKKGYFANCTEGSDEYNTRVKKALEKFQAKNTLSPEQWKQKGNELMSECKYQEAIHAYTKAIEADGSNHIYYANRAAAQTYLKDYRAAIMDCERAIALDSNYVKAYARLGNALFHEQQYEKAIGAYEKAVALDPTNVSYQTDLKLAKDQWEEAKNSRAAATTGAGAGGPGGPFAMPGFDMNRVNQMMSNPEMMKMAFQMAQNPAFNQMMMEASQHVKGATPEEQIASMMEYLRTPDATGNVRTPFGAMNPERLRKLQEEAALTNPKMRAIMEECKTQGPDAFYKYMNDPDVMELMTKMMSEVNADGST